MEKVDKHFNVSEVVWARARRPKSEIFWPAQIVTTEKTPRKLKSKIIATVKFLGEDTYEDVKDAKDIMGWDCKEQCSFIQDGRASIKKPQKKICFNKGVAEAKKLFGVHNGHENKHKELGDLQKTPHKSCSSDVKFVDEEKNVKVLTKQCNTKTEEMKNDKAPNSGTKQQNHAQKRVKRNETEEKQMNTNEPKFKRPKIFDTCESLIRRTSPGKPYGKDESSNKIKMKKRKNVLGKEFSNTKKMSQTHFVGKTTDNETQNEKNGKSCSQSVNRKRRRKRKRGEKSKHNVCEDATHQSKDKDVNNSYSSTISSKQQEDRKLELTENKQSHKKGTTRPLPKISDNDNACAIDPAKSEKNYVLNNEKKRVMKTEEESDSCSDEELMETVLSPSSKNLKFELNDIVWAKLYRDPFWPAQVKRITGNKKAKKFYVKFLGYYSGNCFSCKRLVPFACDSEKREEFVVEAKSFSPNQFNEAFTIAEDLVRRKALGIQDESEEVSEFVDTDDVKDAALIVTRDQPEKEVFKPNDAEDVKPLEETVITKKPTRTVKQPSKYKDILIYIKEGKPFLKEIFEEKQPCQRHQLFKTGSAKEKNSLKRRSGFGPISDSDLENDIMELLQDYYREVVGSDEDFSEVSYISDVWLPEVMIYALQKLWKVDRKTAEDLYLRGPSHGNRGKRFTQRLKAKTLTEEERAESLQRAEKAFSRSFSL